MRVDPGRPSRTCAATPAAPPRGRSPRKPATARSRSRRPARGTAGTRCLLGTASGGSDYRGAARNRHPGGICGAAGFTRATQCGPRAFEAALLSAESPGQFLPAVERGISVWAAHRFPDCTTRLRTTESWPLNSAGLFSSMDTATAA